jgi:chromosome segregation ATPase
VNEQSLQESNGVLKAAESRTEIGQLIPASPAELAAETGITDRLSVARAVRALMARGRIAQEGDRYRLLDARPLEAGEPATVRRPTRRRRRAEPSADGAQEQERPTYEGIGRAVIERLVELSAQSAELRTALERARSEADAARREAMEVARQASADRRRANNVEDDLTTLRRRLEMTEANLRTVVEAARNRPAAPLEDADAQAILDILATRDRPE